MDEPKVMLEMMLSQARALARAAEIFSRIGIGQLEIVGEMVRNGTVPRRRDSDEDREMLSPERCKTFDALVNEAKSVLGYPEHGSNGIGHKHVDKAVHRAWEVHAVLRQAIAFHDDPTPKRAGVWHDGLRVRYTDDPVPVAKVG